MCAKVSVIIPNWNRAGLLDAALACLRRQTRPADEILVVDNGSGDESIDVAVRAGVRVIELRENSGFCRAVNEGIRAASGDWIVILNNDVEVGEEWLAILLDRAIARDAWFATGKPLRSGWAWGQEYLRNGVAAFVANVGKGKLYAFGPEITFRAQTHGVFKWLFNEMYVGQ